MDTNVILHDSSCINNFHEHDVVMPITVIEELDQFKKGNQSVNFQTREFVRTLVDAQNLTPHEVKAIITRAGEGTKIAFTDDIHQIDLPYLDSQSNGLSHLIEKMRGQALYAHINLEKGERSELALLASEL